MNHQWRFDLYISKVKMMRRMNRDVWIFFLMIVVNQACDANTDSEDKRGAKHWMEIHRPSVGYMYVDSVAIESIMDRGENKEDIREHFKAYLVGFVDSVSSSDKEVNIKKVKYYEYDVQDDWSASITGISIKPVFYQRKFVGKPGINEGVIVFETDAGHYPDTLIYQDSYSSWGIQKFILKGE